MSCRRVLAFVASTLLSGGFFVSVEAPPAAADPLTAQAAIGVTYPSPTTFHVCAAGRDDSGGTGEWVFRIEGLRGDGTEIQFQETTFGSSFSDCAYPDISTNGTQDGCAFATLLFAHIPPIDATGTQTSGTPEPVGVAGDVIDWTPQQNDSGFGT